MPMPRTKRAKASIQLIAIAQRFPRSRLSQMLSRHHRLGAKAGSEAETPLTPEARLKRLGFNNPFSSSGNCNLTLLLIGPWWRDAAPLFKEMIISRVLSLYSGKVNELSTQRPRQQQRIEPHSPSEQNYLHRSHRLMITLLVLSPPSWLSSDIEVSRCRDVIPVRHLRGGV